MNGLAGHSVRIITGPIHLLDRLSVPCREARKHQNGQDGQDKLHLAALHEHIDQAGNYNAEQTHNHERAHRTQVFTGCIAVEA